MFLDEAMENPAFWLLGGGGVAAELLGYTYSRNSGMAVFPWWQLLILIAGTIIVAAVFANQD
jgi:hypothetical protein